jgi:hypothetical protein
VSFICEFRVELCVVDNFGLIYVLLIMLVLIMNSDSKCGVLIAVIC